MQAAARARRYEIKSNRAEPKAGAAPIKLNHRRAR